MNFLMVVMKTSGKPVKHTKFSVQPSCGKEPVPAFFMFFPKQLLDQLNHLKENFPECFDTQGKMSMLAELTRIGILNDRKGLIGFDNEIHPCNHDLLLGASCVDSDAVQHREICRASSHADSNMFAFLRCQRPPIWNVSWQASRILHLQWQ